jgi:thiamine pyrophosphate-dependent enzyme
LNIAQALLDALKARGGRQVFGIPGDFALPFFKVIEDSATLPLYCLSHEPAVGFAADAFRSTPMSMRFSRSLTVSRCCSAIRARLPGRTHFRPAWWPMTARSPRSTSHAPLTT